MPAILITNHVHLGYHVQNHNFRKRICWEDKESVSTSRIKVDDRPVYNASASIGSFLNKSKLHLQPRSGVLLSQYYPNIL